MKILLSIALAGLALAASAPAAACSSHKASWDGASIQTAVDTLGKPDRSYFAAGRLVYVWNRGDACRHAFAFDNTGTVVRAHSRGSACQRPSPERHPS